MGAKIAIDDFGTGYSSLSRIKNLPVHTIKIDKSFTKDVTTNKTSLALVKAIISFANALELQVIAEGVESKNQAELLLANGCRYAQGYYFSKPVSPQLCRLMSQNHQLSHAMCG